MLKPTNLFSTFPFYMNRNVDVDDFFKSWADDTGTTYVNDVVFNSFQSSINMKSKNGKVDITKMTKHNDSPPVITNYTLKRNSSKKPETKKRRNTKKNKGKK